MRGDIFAGSGWEFLHCVHSLLVSATAAMVLVAAKLVEPGHMHAWQALGGLGAYFAGVPLFFALERRLFRKRRALPVPDRFGGGRQALTIMAVVFCLAGGDRTAGLAGWIALSALVLGSAADGAWLALVAGRRGVGLCGALRELRANERTAQERYWAALFGRNGAWRR